MDSYAEYRYSMPYQKHRATLVASLITLRNVSVSVLTTRYLGGGTANYSKASLADDSVHSSAQCSLYTRCQRMLWFNTILMALPIDFAPSSSKM